jgi:hypothetical protein
MPGSLSFFDEVAAAGEDFFAAVRRSRSGDDAKRAYLELLEDTYSALATVHRHVADMVGELEHARDKREMQATLNRLSAMGLKDHMKAKELCDRLESDGKQLRTMLKSRAGLTRANREVWDELSQKLEHRELQTAWLYYDKLEEIRHIPNQHESGEAASEEVRRIRSLLMTQKAQFDRLVAEARRERERLL